MMTVIDLTWKEILRKKVLLITLVMTAIFLILYDLAVKELAESVNSLGQVSGVRETEIMLERLMNGGIGISLGFYFANFVIAYLVIFSTVGAISSEIESGLLLAILPRPIRRWQWYLGRWAGYAIWSVLYGALLYLAILLIIQVEMGLPAGSFPLLSGFGLFALIGLALVTTCLLGSLFLPTLGNGVVMVLLFSLGLLGGLVERMSLLMGLRPEQQEAMMNIGLVTSFFSPYDALYRRMMQELIGLTDVFTAQQLQNGFIGLFVSPIVPSNAFLIYTAFYIAVLLAFGMWRFTKRDI